MFARKLTAGTGTLESRLAQVYFCLVGRAPATLALAPNRSFVTAERLPLSSAGQPLAGFQRSCIGRQSVDPLYRQCCVIRLDHSWKVSEIYLVPFTAGRTGVGT